MAVDKLMDGGAVQPGAWHAIDPLNAPAPGLYWVAGERDLWDVDEGADGQIAGRPTGEVEQFVVLASLDVYPDGDGAQMEWVSLDEWALGRIYETDRLTHCQPYAAPGHPREGGGTSPEVLRVRRVLLEEALGQIVLTQCAGCSDDLCCSPPTPAVVRELQALLGDGKPDPEPESPDAPLEVWRATDKWGRQCHFGAPSLAKAWLRGGEGRVERIVLPRRDRQSEVEP